MFAALYLVAYTSLGLPAVLAALVAEQIGIIPAYHLLAAVVGVVAAISLGVVLRGRGAVEQ